MKLLLFHMKRKAVITKVTKLVVKEKKSNFIHYDMQIKIYMQNVTS